MFEPIISRSQAIDMVEEYEKIERLALEFGYLASRIGMLEAIYKKLPEVKKYSQVYCKYIDRKSLKNSEIRELINNREILEFTSYLGILCILDEDLGTRHDEFINLGDVLSDFQKNRIFDFFLSHYKSIYRANSAVSYLGIDGEDYLDERFNTLGIISRFRVTSYGSISSKDGYVDSYYKLLNHKLGLSIYDLDSESMLYGLNLDKRLPPKMKNFIYERNVENTQKEILELIEFINDFSENPRKLGPKEDFSVYKIFHRYPEVLAYMASKFRNMELGIYLYEYLSDYLKARERFIIHYMAISPASVILDYGLGAFIDNLEDPSYGINHMIMAIIIKFFNREIDEYNVDLLMLRLEEECLDYISDYLIGLYKFIRYGEEIENYPRELLKRLPSIMAKSLFNESIGVNPYLYFDLSGDNYILDKKDYGYIKYLEFINEKFELPNIRRQYNIKILEKTEKTHKTCHNSKENLLVGKLVDLARVNPEFLDFSWILNKLDTKDLDPILEVLGEKGIKIPLSQVSMNVRRDREKLKKIIEYIE